MKCAQDRNAGAVFDGLHGPKPSTTPCTTPYNNWFKVKGDVPCPRGRVIYLRSPSHPAVSERPGVPTVWPWTQGKSWVPVGSCVGGEHGVEKGDTGGPDEAWMKDSWRLLQPGSSSDCTGRAERWAFIRRKLLCPHKRNGTPISAATPPPPHPYSPVTCHQSPVFSGLRCFFFFLFFLLSRTRIF